MASVLLLPLLFAVPDAAAQAPGDAPAPPATELVGGTELVYRRNALMELNLRGRYLTLPDSILDIWYFNEDDAGVNELRRPKARGYAAGVEYVLKPHPANWIFYVEYAGSLMGEGYWDDVEEPAQHDDGDYVRPDRFGIFSMGANYGHELNPAPWIGFMIGGGLGVGFVTGELVQWNGGDPDNSEPDCLPNAAAYERVDICEDDGHKRIPGVIPMVDVNAAIKFNFGDSATFRIDGGLHNLIYMGAAVGVVF